MCKYVKKIIERWARVRDWEGDGIWIWFYRIRSVWIDGEKAVFLVDGLFVKLREGYFSGMEKYGFLFEKVSLLLRWVIWLKYYY